MNYNQITETLNKLYLQYYGENAIEISALPASGSDRQYFRLRGKFTAIGTYNKDVFENETFIKFTRHFASKNVSVPNIYAVSDDSKCYLQEDIGDTTLYQLIRKEGFTTNIRDLYVKVLESLVHLQIDGAKDFNFNRCYPIRSFDKSSMFWDMNSFKYYFVRPARVRFNETALNKDFHALSDYLLQEKNAYFMFRDCQSRNIMIKDETPYFIDYQGGRKGALQYDAASLLWQANAKIPHKDRDILFDVYSDFVSQKISIDAHDFKCRYHGFVLIRLLQVLGTYGFRGMIEKKSHFVESIPPAIDNLQYFAENIPLEISLPELYQVFQQLIIKKSWENERTDFGNHPLQIAINSFSYRRGLPKDDSGNGGGYVFDCRSIHNPGRYEPYKHLTGRDKPVIDFLESQSNVKDFLSSIISIVDMSIEAYIERGFEHLQVNFGCTGGQHRSVYCAETLGKHIREKYNLKVIVHHIERALSDVNWKE
jgi:aminoglycoside/choline kinase family phosphotransferase